MDLFNSLNKDKLAEALKELEEKQPANEAEIEAILNKHGFRRLPDGRLVPYVKDSGI